MFRSRLRDFCQIFEGFGFGQFGLGKKSLKKKSLGFGKFGSGKKVSVSVSVKILVSSFSVWSAGCSIDRACTYFISKVA